MKAILTFLRVNISEAYTCWTEIENNNTTDNTNNRVTTVFHFCLMTFPKKQPQ